MPCHGMRRRRMGPLSDADAVGASRAAGAAVSPSRKRLHTQKEQTMTALSQPLPDAASSSSSSSSSRLPPPAAAGDAEAAAAAAEAALARRHFPPVSLSPSVSLFPKSAHPSFLFSAGDEVEAQLQAAVWRRAEVVEMSSGGCGAGAEDRQRYWKVSFTGLSSAYDRWVSLSDIRGRQPTPQPPQQTQSQTPTQTQRLQTPAHKQTPPSPSPSSSCSCSSSSCPSPLPSALSLATELAGVKAQLLKAREGREVVQALCQELQEAVEHYDDVVSSLNQLVAVKLQEVAAEAAKVRSEQQRGLLLSAQLSDCSERAEQLERKLESESIADLQLRYAAAVARLQRQPELSFLSLDAVRAITSFHYDQIQQLHLLLQAVDEEKRRSVPEKLLCKICCQLPLSIIMMPCRHALACQECAQRFTRCPVCRAAVTAREPLFIG